MIVSKQTFSDMSCF